MCTEQRVKSAQTQGQGPPSAPVEILKGTKIVPEIMTSDNIIDEIEIKPESIAKQSFLSILANNKALSDLF